MSVGHCPGYFALHALLLCLTAMEEDRELMNHHQLSPIGDSGHAKSKAARLASYGA
jgi:hypothetical protein